LVWRQQGHAIIGDGALDNLGYSVAMSTNATTMVIGELRYTTIIQDTGYVKVYHKVGGGENWTQLGQSIHGNETDDY